MKPHLLWLAVLAIALAGCSTHHTVATAPRVDAGAPGEPSATSPVSTVRRLQWCCDHQDIADYEGLFTADFAAHSASAIVPDPNPAWGYVDELQSALHLLVGGGARPRPFSYQVLLDDSLVDRPDLRLGKTAAVHRIVRTLARLDLIPGDTTVVEYEGSVPQMFFLVRGDSAAIPAELVAQGVRPDSTRWWIERWEEGASTVPAHRLSGTPLPAIWLDLRRMYRASASTRAARASR